MKGFIDEAVKAGPNGFLPEDESLYPVEKNYSQEEAERQDNLSGNDPLDIRPVIPEVDYSEPAEVSAERIVDQQARQSYLSEMQRAVGSAGITKDVTANLMDSSVGAKAAAANATFSAAQTMVQAEINRLAEEDGDDSVIEDIGEFIYEAGVSVLDAPARAVGQQFTDDPISDFRIVDEFRKLAFEEGPAAALSYLQDNLADAGEDLFGYQKVSRLQRIAEGINNAGTTVTEEALGTFDIATLGAVGLVRKGARSAVSTTQRAVRGARNRDEATLQVVREADGNPVGSLSNEAGAAAADDTTSVRVVEGEGIGPNRVNAATSAAHRVMGRVEKAVLDTFASPQAGRVAEQSAIREVANTVAAQVVSRIGRNLKDFSVVSDGLEIQSGVIKTEARIGKADGTSFGTKLSAQSFAASLRKKAPEGDIVFDVAEDAEGYVVTAIKAERIKSKDLVMNSIRDHDDTGSKVKRAVEGVRDMTLRLFGNSYERLPSQNTVQQESVRAFIGKEISEAYRETIRSLPKKDYRNLNDLVMRLRDGDLAHRRQALTDVEFQDEWMRMFDEAPDDKVMEAYRSFLDMERASWRAQAQQVLSGYLHRGYDIGVDVMTGNNRRVLPARVVSGDSLLDEDVIYDIRFGKSYTKGDLPSRYQGSGIYRVSGLDAEDSSIRYVVNPERQPTLLSLDDVYGYNTGGNRINPNSNYFVEIGADLSDSAKVRTLGSATTEKQARQFVQEINNIRQAIRQGADDVDEVIRKNNGFEPEVTDRDSFIAWMERQGVGLMDDATQVGYKARDEVVEFTGSDGPVMTKVHSETIKRQRQDTVLPHFGGGQAAQFDALDYIHQSTQSSIYNVTRNAVGIADVESFMFRNKHLIENWEEIREMNPVGMAANARLSLSTKESRQAREQLDILAGRLHVDTAGEKKLKAYGQRAAEFILDMKGGFPKPVQDTGIFENVARRFTDPTNELLHLGFISKFGFFNFSQLVLQAMHVPVIMAISPKAGLQASKVMPHMWAAINVTDKAASDLALERLSKVSGVPVKDLKEMKTDLVKSGRAIINSDAAELGAPSSRGFQQFGAEDYSKSKIAEVTDSMGRAATKFKDSSLLFFNQGEQVSRIFSRLTANMEYRAKFPGRATDTPEALKWIADRDATLSFHMTSSGRAKAQRGLLKVPTQWMTYILRAHEAVFVGRNLTKAERARAGLMLGPFWGASGVPFASQKDADELSDYLGVEPGGAWHTLFKTGVIEAGLAAMLGSENIPNIGFRSAPVQGAVDMWNNVVEGQALETLGGPSGEILWNMGAPLVKAVAHAANGRDVLAYDEAMQSIRNIAGLDNAFKAAGIINHGTYTSKAGAVVPGKFSTTEALFTVLGLTPAQVSRYYQAQQEGYDYGKNKRAMLRYVNRTYQKAFESNDDENLASTLTQLVDVINMSGLTEQDKYDLRMAITTNTIDRSMRKYAQLPRDVSDDATDFRVRANIRDLVQ